MTTLDWVILLILFVGGVCLILTCVWIVANLVDNNRRRADPLRQMVGGISDLPITMERRHG